MTESKEFSLKGNKYTIKFPTVGQFYQIEALKQVLGKGFYSSIVQTATMQSSYALDMIDIEATLTVLCPQFLKDLKIDSFQELGLIDYKEIHKAFMSQIAPFLKEVNELLSEVPTAEEK